MEVRRRPELHSRSPAEFGSERAAITFLAGGDARVVAFELELELEPSGRIGLHPAVDDQLLVVVSGTALAAVVVEAPELRLG